MKSLDEMTDREIQSYYDNYPQQLWTIVFNYTYDWLSDNRDEYLSGRLDPCDMILELDWPGDEVIIEFYRRAHDAAVCEFDHIFIGNE